ncbi:MAG: Flp pilus assembly protein TadG [Myxococcota bacterium]|jgi:Flp pilus assembly protein TadG
MTRRQRRGSTAIEFALTLPIPILLLGAVLEYGSFISQREAVAGVVRDASRLAAAVPQDDESNVPTSDIQTTAIKKATALLTTYGVRCESLCRFETLIDTSGTLTTLTLSANIDYQPLFPLIPSPDVVVISHTVALEDQ